jgi:hypothetical protein
MPQFLDTFPEAKDKAIQGTLIATVNPSFSFLFLSFSARLHAYLINYQDHYICGNFFCVFWCDRRPPESKADHWFWGNNLWPWMCPGS